MINISLKTDQAERLLRILAKHPIEECLDIFGTVQNALVNSSKMPEDSTAERLADSAVHKTANGGLAFATK